MFSGTLKDIITNIVAVLVVVAEVVKAVTDFLQSYDFGNFEWASFLLALAIAVIAWFTGKDSEGKPKVQ